VDQLRDDCVDTYWQSDGQLPHLVNVQFRKKTTVQDICIYTDYKLDESYTPSRISIRAGTHFNDLQVSKCKRELTKIIQSDILNQRNRTLKFTFSSAIARFICIILFVFLGN